MATTPPHKIRSRVVKVADLDALAKLEKAHGTDPTWISEWIEQAINRALEPETHDVFRIAETRKLSGRARLIGLIYYRFIGDVVELRRLLVAPEFRRRGVATLLAGHAIRVAKNRPYPVPMGAARTIQAHVCETHLDVHLFFKSVGLECRRTTHQTFGGKDGYLFESAPIPYEAGVQEEVEG